MVVVLDKFFPLLVIWKSFLFFVNFFFEERKRESEVAQSCLTVCNSVDSSLPGSSVHGILQARILEWVAISFSISFSPSPGDLPDPGIEPRSPALQADALSSELPGKPKTRLDYSLSHVRLFVTQWTVAHQAPPSMGFSRQEYWSGLPFPSPGDLPDPGIEPRSPALQADALTSEPPGNP